MDYTRTLHNVHDLVQVSALNWDHNDRHPQFSGHHAFLPDGYSKLLHKLAEQVNVKLNCPVSRVTWSPDEEFVTIQDKNWQKWTAKKVHFYVYVELPRLIVHLVGGKC